MAGLYGPCHEPLARDALSREKVYLILLWFNQQIRGSGARLLTSVGTHCFTNNKTIVHTYQMIQERNRLHTC